MPSQCEAKLPLRKKAGPIRPSRHAPSTTIEQGRSSPQAPVCGHPDSIPNMKKRCKQQLKVTLGIYADRTYPATGAEVKLLEGSVLLSEAALQVRPFLPSGQDGTAGGQRPQTMPEAALCNRGLRGIPERGVRRGSTAKLRWWAAALALPAEGWLPELVCPRRETAHRDELQGVGPIFGRAHQSRAHPEEFQAGAAHSLVSLGMRGTSAVQRAKQMLKDPLTEARPARTTYLGFPMYSQLPSLPNAM